jgi:hypothetical protein
VALRRLFSALQLRAEIHPCRINSSGNRIVVDRMSLAPKFIAFMLAATFSKSSGAFSSLDYIAQALTAPDGSIAI